MTAHKPTGAEIPEARGCETDHATFLRNWADDIRANSGKSVDADRLDAIAEALSEARAQGLQEGREQAKKAAQDYCWERYKGRDPLNLTYPAVFTSHEWQKIGERIDARCAAIRN